MKSKFLFFLFIILLSQFVVAVGFSPSSLVFNLNQNVEECKKIILDSESEKITVYDKWAENATAEWKASAFNKSASEHGISINYDNELSREEREVEVCLSGRKIGEYHGIIIFQQQQEGNSIIQIGVWLKVVISEKTEEVPSQPPASSDKGNSQSSGGGTSGSGTGGGTIISSKKSSNIDLLNTSDKKDNKKEKMVEELNVNLSSKENDDVSEGVVSEDYSEDKGTISWIVWIALALVAVISVMIINNIKKKR